MRTNGKVEIIVGPRPVSRAGIENFPCIAGEPLDIFRVQRIGGAARFIRHDIENMRRKIKRIMPTADIQDPRQVPANFAQFGQI